MTDISSLFSLLDLRLDAFAVCEVQNGWALKVAASDNVLVHFVLQGAGSIESKHGIIPVDAGMMVIIPRALPKLINGAGPVTRFADAAESCPLTEHMVRFQACQDRADLVLGCAAVSANVCGVPAFAHLQVPLAIKAQDPVLPFLFQALSAELRRPGVGTTALVQGIMSQVVLIMLRCHLQDDWENSPLRLSKSRPELSRAVLAMTSEPEARHTVSSLAALSGMSRSAFIHHFNATYGRTPKDFLLSVRLRRASQLLQQSGKRVKAVSADVGFSSRSHFSRAFRAEYGVDPTAYRRMHAVEVTAHPGAMNDSGPDVEPQSSKQTTSKRA
jgi:AraC-like DNA-binding protein